MCGEDLGAVDPRDLAGEREEEREEVDAREGEVASWCSGCVCAGFCLGVAVEGDICAEIPAWK